MRSLDPSTLGKAHIQLELLLTTILFVSREGFRLALTRNVVPTNWTVAWLTLPLVTLISTSVLAWHLLKATKSLGTNDYRLAGVLTIAASWIEACAEPVVLFFLRRMQVPVRATAESIATVVKTLATVIGLKVFSTEWQVTALGLAQLVYAVTYAVYLYWRAYAAGDEWKRLVPGSKMSSLPSFGSSSFWQQLDRDTCYMVMVFTLQGLFKHLLTEADRIVLATVADSYDQGVYAMGASYGGLAARILLQPLEENARLLWSRLASRADNEKGQGIDELKDSYTTLVKLVLYVGLTFACIAVNFTNLLLNFLAGRKWGSNEEAAVVLSAFCVYTAFLSLNGMTEALVYGVASTFNKEGKRNGGGEMGRLSIVHTVTGVTFAVSSSFLVTRYGTVGLVGANCLAMSIRSLYSLFFAARYFEEHGQKEKQAGTLIRGISPHPVVLLGFLLAWVATRWSLRPLVENGYHLRLDIRNKEWVQLTCQHLAVGILCAIGIFSTAALVDRSFLRSLRGMVARQSHSQRPKQE